MIPSQNIVAWANVVPWVGPRQVEQDLITSRSLVEMFSDRKSRCVQRTLVGRLWGRQTNPEKIFL